MQNEKLFQLHSTRHCYIRVVSSRRLLGLGMVIFMLFSIVTAVAQEASLFRF